MSRPQGPYRPLLPFGNPFKMMLPKSSYPSPRLISLLINFEEALAERFKKLNPKGREDLLSLSWMRSAVDLVCETHIDIKTIITELELPVHNWDDKWIDVYLDNSVNLLGICIAFSSELSRLNQGHLLLQCALHNLDASSSSQFVRAYSSLDGWKKHIRSKNPRLENCFPILHSLTETVNLPKVKKSAKGKVLVQAMYGVKVLTLFVCSILAAAFLGSANELVDLQVQETYLWAQAFADARAYVNEEMINILSSGRVTVVKEIEAVEVSVKELCPMLKDGVDSTEAKTLQNSISELGKRAEKLSHGVDHLVNQVNSFFRIILRGRDALLCNLRAGSGLPDPMQKTNKLEGQAKQKTNNVEGQAMQRTNNVQGQAAAR